jgi:prevent-host-death family protein
MVLSATVVASATKNAKGKARHDHPDYHDQMREIGVGELKAKLSSVLERVEHGERVRVTRRGRPIAELVPAMPERSEAMEKLIAEGRVTPASRPLPMNPPSPRDTGRSASAFVLAEREEER